MIYYDSNADVLLLYVPGAVPDSFHAFKLGYDGSPTTTPSAVVGIHSPGGNYKHISFANGTYAPILLTTIPQQAQTLADCS